MYVRVRTGIYVVRTVGREPKTYVLKAVHNLLTSL
jgi:hypothetical protein